MKSIKVQGSKSIFNRAYLIKSYDSDFEIKGSSLCDDVLVIQKALESFKKNEVIYCKDSGTAFRFMALRVSRTLGEYVLTGTQQLFRRNHQALESILSQLGVQVQVQENERWIIKTKGWNPQGDAITFPSHVSSQFASSLLINSYDLEKDLYISLEGSAVSLSYLEMTIRFLKKIGIMVQGKFPEYYMPAGQTLTQKFYEVEPDMSGLFALACYASLKNGLEYVQWPEKSLQPDAIFPDILSQMGIDIEVQEKKLTIKESSFRKGISINLCHNPDLFPCLAVLCCLSEGQSLLHGVPQLRFKESDRLERTYQLIKSTGRKAEIIRDGIKIEGSLEKGAGLNIIFDPKKDHRMAMAAGLFRLVGFNVTLKNSDCVSKSFPDFWNQVSVLNE